jgi:AcrR family transcriptional regulator
MSKHIAPAESSKSLTNPGDAKTETSTTLVAPQSPRARILDAAQELFMRDGYAAVSLRQVAAAAGIRQATLYHHFPDGKEALYVAMLERFFARQQAGLTHAIQDAPPTFHERLTAAFRWLGAQKGVHYMAMMYADMPALDQARARDVSQLVYRSLFGPRLTLFAQAIADGEARPTSPEFLAGAVIALSDGITFSMTQEHTVPRKILEDEMVRLVVEGVGLRASPMPRVATETGATANTNKGNT